MLLWSWSCVDFCLEKYTKKLRILSMAHSIQSCNEIHNKQQQHNKLTHTTNHTITASMIMKLNLQQPLQLDLPLLLHPTLNNTHKQMHTHNTTTHNDHLLQNREHDLHDLDPGPFQGIEYNFFGFFNSLCCRSRSGSRSGSGSMSRSRSRSGSRSVSSSRSRYLHSCVAIQHS